MRILVVQESNWLTRGPHQQHHLMERLKQRGHQVRVIDFEIDWREREQYVPVSKTQILEAPGKVIKNQTITVVRPPMIRAPLLSYLSILVFHFVMILRTIKSFRPDVIVGLGLINCYLAAKLSKLFRIPFVFYLIDSLHTLIPERALQPLGKCFERKTLQLATKVLAINRLLGSYATRLGATQEPEIISAGIDKTMFNPEVDGSSIRKRLGLRDDNTTLFFMGWFYEFSGLREVAQEIMKNESNLTLLVLGRGELAKELRNMQEMAATEGRIRLVDWVPYEEVPRYIAASDICILPAKLNVIMRDIVPIKVYEYLACRKPVIATRLPGVMAEFGENSGVVYVNEPKEVIGEAKAISANRKRCRQLKTEAIAFTKDLAWENIVDRFYGLLKSADVYDDNCTSY